MVKGCVVSLLQDAYVKRTRVAAISYGGAHARVVLPFTASAEMAAKRIDEMLGGGSTPLLQALELAVPLLEALEGQDREIVVLSDGRYDRPAHTSAERQIRSFAAYCGRNKISVLLVDSGAGTRTARKRAARLAQMLHAKFRTLDSLRADELREALDSSVLKK